MRNYSARIEEVWPYDSFSRLIDLELKQSIACSETAKEGGEVGSHRYDPEELGVSRIEGFTARLLTKTASFILDRS